MSTATDAMATMIRNLEEKSGKSLADWVAIVKKSGKSKHGEIVKHLKDEHALGHGYANLIAHNALESASTHSADDDLIETQYAGAKAALRPAYEKILAAVKKFGDDVEVSPKKAYVSLRRSKQFAIVQPSTATRLDVGLNLKGEPVTERLEAGSSWNAMATHRVRLTGEKDVDKELIAWLKKAYDAS